MLGVGWTILTSNVPCQKVVSAHDIAKPGFRDCRRRDDVLQYWFRWVPHTNPSGDSQIKRLALRKYGEDQAGRQTTSRRARHVKVRTISMLQSRHGKASKCSIAVTLSFPLKITIADELLEPSKKSQGNWDWWQVVGSLTANGTGKGDESADASDDYDADVGGTKPERFRHEKGHKRNSQRWDRRASIICQYRLI